MTISRNRNGRSSVGRLVRHARDAYSLYRRYGGAAHQVGSVVQEAFGRVSNHFSNKRRRASSSDEGMVASLINSERLATVRYRSKRESKRHKRARVRVAREARVEALSQVAPDTFITLTRTDWTSAVDQQSMNFLRPLYSYNGTAGSLNDIARIMNISDVTQPTVPSGATTNLAYSKCHFIGAHQTVEITNTGSSSAYITLTEYYMTKDFENANLGGLLTANIPMTTAVAVGATQIGATPWDFGQFIHHCHITKVTEILIGPFATQEYDWGDSRDKTWDNSLYFGATAGSQVGRAGWTKGILMTLVGPVSAVSDGTASTITTLVTNKYTCKFIPDEQLKALPTTSISF